MLQIGFVNQATRFTDDELAAAAHACNVQAVDASNHWGFRYRVAHYEATAAVPPEVAIIAVFDDADQAGALGWHDRTPDGRPYGRVFAGPVLDNGGNALDAALSVASVLSHEALETAGDPAANLWADDGNGNFWPMELADACESDSYLLSVVMAAGTRPVFVTVSDFLLPSFFDPGAPGPYDRLGAITAPFTLAPGGYTVTATAGQMQTQWGEDYPEWRKELKAFPAARTARRLARLTATP